MTAYNCSHANTTFTTINLIEPEDCPDPEDDYEKVEKKRVELIQTDTAYPVTAHACQVTYSKRVSHCGFDHIAYAPHHIAFGKTLEFTPKECRKAVRTRQLEVFGQVYKIPLGSRHHVHYVSHGALWDNGYCDSAQFVSEGRQFTSSVEEVFLTLQLKLIRGTADSATGSLLLNNGLKVKWKDGVVKDANEGTIVWDSSAPPCLQTVSGIYHGYAHLHRRKGLPELQESIVMIENNVSRQYAGLVLKESNSICGKQIWSTQISGLVVHLPREGDGLMDEYEFDKRMDQEQISIATEISQLHLSTNLAMYRRFREVQINLCKLERYTLYNKLQAIAGNNRYGLLDVMGRGHEVYVAGAVAHVAQCAEEEVAIRDHPNCTLEVPVTVQGPNGTTYGRFADPFTWVLKPYPTTIPCSPIMPIMWRISGDWYCAQPNTSPCPEPLKLNTSIDPFVPEDFAIRIGADAYTESQKNQHAQFRDSQVGIDPTLQEMTNAATRGGSPDTGTLGWVLSDAQVANLGDLVASLVSPMFATFGKAWNVIVGIFLSIMVFKIVVGCVIRTYVIYCERGCGWWMLAALWGTLFAVIRIPWETVRHIRDTLLAPIDQSYGPPSFPPDPRSPYRDSHRTVRQELANFSSDSDQSTGFTTARTRRHSTGSFRGLALRDRRDSQERLISTMGGTLRRRGTGTENAGPASTSTPAASAGVFRFGVLPTPIVPPGTVTGAIPRATADTTTTSAPMEFTDPQGQDGASAPPPPFTTL